VCNQKSLVAESFYSVRISGTRWKDLHFPGASGTISPGDYCYLMPEADFTEGALDDGRRFACAAGGEITEADDSGGHAHTRAMKALPHAKTLEHGTSPQ
jgi:hypothetical protein